MTGRRTLRQLLVVMRKEVMDSLRDRRALWSIGFSIIFGPLMITFMLDRAAERSREAEEVTIPVVGIEHAPALVEWLRQQSGVEVIPGPDDPEKAVREQDADVVVIISPEFADRFRVSRPARVEVVSDGSRSSALPEVERVRTLLQQYNGEIGSLRLIGRGVSPAVVSPLQLDEIEVSTAQERSAQILTFIQLFVILAGFTGGMQIATDSTAGERERGSLEALLVTPAPRSAIVTGKWLAAVVLASATVSITAILCMTIPRFLPLEDMNLRFRLETWQLAGILAAALPACLFSTALQTCIATFARSFKEAQSYMGILVLVPAIPGILAAVYPLGNQPWMYSVPLLGSYVLMTNVLGGREVQAVAFLTVAAVCLVTAALLVRLVTMLFHNERIIFGR